MARDGTLTQSLHREKKSGQFETDVDARILCESEARDENHSVDHISRRMAATLEAVRTEKMIFRGDEPNLNSFQSYFTLRAIIYFTR